eukprot:410667-Rhodomonas_salina.2
MSFLSPFFFFSFSSFSLSLATHLSALLALRPVSIQTKGKKEEKNRDAKSTDEEESVRGAGEALDWGRGREGGGGDGGDRVG